MTPGNVFSTADAQKINQSILAQYTPTGFDFYTMDVNGTDGTISIADVYSVYGRLAGRFSSWPNSKKDVMFFTVSEYNAINGSTANLTATYSTINYLIYFITHFIIIIISIKIYIKVIFINTSQPDCTDQSP